MRRSTLLCYLTITKQGETKSKYLCLDCKEHHSIGRERNIFASTLKGIYQREVMRFINKIDIALCMISSGQIQTHLLFTGCVIAVVGKHHCVFAAICRSQNIDLCILRRCRNLITQTVELTKGLKGIIAFLGVY